MIRVLKAVFIAECVCASALGALGDIWGANAARRLRKLSGKLSENAGGEK